MINDQLSKETSVIFVLESPHTSEVSKNIPLAGASGMVFSRVLLNNSVTPAGEIISAGNSGFSIVNTFHYPLQSDTQNNPFSELGSAIQKLRFTDPCQYKKSLKNLFLQHIKESELNNYKERLLNAVSSSCQKKLVFCGLISQAYIEYALELEIQEFGKAFDLNIFGIQTSVFYVWHPSPRSGKKFRPNREKISAWEDNCNQKIINSLKSFIRP